MMNKKLAALLASAVMLGQVSLVTGVFAQDQTGSTTPSNSQDLLQVASVINHTDLDIQSDSSPNGSKQPETPDIYTIGHGAGTLPTVIQVLSQDDAATSLFVNGTEILRFNGEVADMSAYARVKTIADRLNNILERDSKMASHIHPAVVNGQAVIKVGESILATVDAETVKTAQEKAPKLSLLYSNRLRQVLGAQPLDEKVLNTMTASSQPHFKATGRVQSGMASWYGPHFHGRRSADGSRFNQFALTAAHRTLPFGTMVRVMNQRTHKACFVKITDRGPFAHGRIIDLSRGAASAIGMLGSGVAKVSVEVVAKGS